jgi:hypothetical protein
MTKLTEMPATARRAVARKHRVEATVLKTELAAIVGFTPRAVSLKANMVFHTAQAKLWETAAAYAESTGFVRLV